MTDKQILEKLGEDLDHTLQFVVDNRPDLVVQELKRFGYDVDNAEQAFKTLKALADTRPENLPVILENWTYKKDAENWTGGLDESKVRSQLRGDQDGPSVQVWGQIGAAVGGLIGNMTGDDDGGGGGPSAEVIAEQKAQRRTMYVIAGAAAVILLILGIFIANR